LNTVPGRKLVKLLSDGTRLPFTSTMWNATTLLAEVSAPTPKMKTSAHSWGARVVGSPILKMVRIGGGILSLLASLCEK
jgi:hypothetical protein